MGSTGRRGKHNRTDRRSRLSEPESSSNPVGFRSEFKESAQNPFSNPDFVANDPDVESVISAVAKNDTENLEILRWKNEEQTHVILGKFRVTNPVEDTEYVPDNKDKTLYRLVIDLIDLETEIMERKKWACEKEMQVAKKLSDDIKELKTLRMKRDTNQPILQKKSTFEDDPEFKSLLDVGIDLRTAHGQAEFGDIVVRELEEENKKIKADMAALMLSTSESVERCFEAAKREKKHRKKYSAWEKQRDKLQEDIKAGKQKLQELQEEMVQVEEAKRNEEAKWREEQEAKKHALTRVKQEKRLKEETILNNKQILESFRAKMGLDFKRHQDDIQRLKQELSRVKSWNDPDHDLTSSFGSHFEDDETIARLLQEMVDEFDETDNLIDRACVMCKQAEVSVVFLPCAHQVLCGGCNKEMKKKGEDKCPACGVLIAQRIRVFGAS